jgi:ADP-heptose:LPS heptosyltransferase
MIGISPSAGNKIKNWGGDKFAKLADYIYGKYRANIFVVGGPRDEEEVKEMVDNLSPETKIINTAGQLNLDELKALISRLNIFVSVDTGPIYIAEAFDVATVDILGPMNAIEQPPVGPRHLVVEIEDRVPQLHIMDVGSYNEVEARRQTDAISVEMVAKAVDLLAKESLLMS